MAMDFPLCVRMLKKSIEKILFFKKVTNDKAVLTEHLSEEDGLCGNSKHVRFLYKSTFVPS